MSASNLDAVREWLTKNPGVFAVDEQADGLALGEIASKKTRILKTAEIERVEKKTNRLNANESYVIILLKTEQQLVISKQGFAFAPDFRNTGPREVPTQVFCMSDYLHIFEQLMHIGPDRKKEAVDLIMTLITLLDGASAVGLDTSREAHKVEQVLQRVEKGLPPDPANEG